MVFPTFSLFFCTNNVKKVGCSLADTGAQAGADAGADAGVTRAGTSQSREEKNSQDDNLFATISAFLPHVR